MGARNFGHSLVAAVSEVWASSTPLPVPSLVAPVEDFCGEVVVYVCCRWEEQDWNYQEEAEFLPDPQALCY